MPIGLKTTKSLGETNPHQRWKSPKVSMWAVWGNRS